MVDEASTAFIRTSFSVLVREANDFAVVLTDAQGRSLAQSTMSIASFIGSLPATVKHFLDVFPAHTLKPGDVMITNDPWMGTGHIHDVNIAMPIFHKGKIVAFAAVVSHMPDIGGRLRNAGVREIFEEGLQIPRLKLIDGGKPNQTLLDMIAQNVRVPEMTLGDIWAQVAACKMLEERLQPLLRDTDLAALGEEIRRRSGSRDAQSDPRRARRRIPLAARARRFRGADRHQLHRARERRHDRHRLHRLVGPGAARGERRADLLLRVFGVRGEGAALSRRAEQRRQLSC